MVFGDLGGGGGVVMGGGTSLAEGGALLMVLGDFLRVSEFGEGGSGALRIGTRRIVEGELLFSGSLQGEGDRSETDPRLMVGDFLTLTALRVFFL
jgi:hypothetical protein